MSIEGMRGPDFASMERRSIVMNLKEKILDRNRPEILLDEGARAWMREKMTENGINLEPFVKGEVQVPGRTYKEEGQDRWTLGDANYKIQFRGQADFVQQALGENFLDFVVDTVMFARELPGGGVAKKPKYVNEDGVEIPAPEGMPTEAVEPSDDELKEFLTVYIGGRMKKKKGFAPSPQAQANKVVGPDGKLVKLPEGSAQVAPWHTNATYRAEAVISTTYALMLMSVTEGEEAKKLQGGNRIDKFLCKRFEEGFRRAKKVVEQKIPRHLKKTKAEEEEIIRHIPYHDGRGTLDEIVDRLTLKRP